MTIFRIDPKLPVEAMKTYAAIVPMSTHLRPATCEEVDCLHYLEGWKTVINESTELGQAQAHYIRKESGRRFTEHREGAAVVFEFEPGQQCFAQHQQPLERDPVFLVKGGDWRGNPTGQVRYHQRAEDWVEDFAEHQLRLLERMQHG